jgi:hypothetical protein
LLSKEHQQKLVEKEEANQNLIEKINKLSSKKSDMVIYSSKPLGMIEIEDDWEPEPKLDAIYL